MATALGLGSGGSAQIVREGPAQRSGLEPRRGHDLIRGHVRDDLSLEQYVARVVDPLRRADRKGDGLDPGDLTRIERDSRAVARANAFDSVLRYDLNGYIII